MSDPEWMQRRINEMIEDIDQGAFRHRHIIDEGATTEEDVRAALTKLDGTPTSAVALLAGMTPEQLDDFGGMS